APLIEKRGEHRRLLVRVIEHQCIFEGLLELRRSHAAREQLRALLRRHPANGLVAEVHRPRELHDAERFHVIVAVAPEGGEDAAAVVAIGEVFEDAAGGPHRVREYSVAWESLPPG